jgi:hypothetical protein
MNEFHNNQGKSMQDILRIGILSTVETSYLGCAVRVLTFDIVANHSLFAEEAPFSEDSCAILAQDSAVKAWRKGKARRSKMTMCCNTAVS